MTPEVDAIPEPLASLGAKALELACIAKANGDAVFPFAFAEKSGEPPKMMVFAGAATAETLAKLGEQFPAIAKGFDAVAMAYDGQILENGVRSERLYVDLWDRAKELCIRAVQRRRPKGLCFRKFERIGSFDVIGYIDKPLAMVPQ